MLLPSPQMRRLSERFDICLSGKKTPPDCDIRYRQLDWLMVFDKQGELRGASKLGDQLGEVMRQGFDLPNAFVEIVEKGHQSKASMQQLQRDYVESRGSLASFEALRAKLKEVYGVGQMGVAAFLATAADKTRDPVLSRARSLWIEADACSHQVINHGAFTRVRKGLVDFIAANPKHAFTGKLLEPLLNVGLRYSFDIDAKCRAYADAWTKAGDSHGKLIASLTKRVAAQREEITKELDELKPKAYQRLRLLAQLGDAKAVLQALEDTKSFGVMRAIHSEWRREATAKTEAAGSK